MSLEKAFQDDLEKELAEALGENTDPDFEEIEGRYMSDPEQRVADGGLEVANAISAALEQPFVGTNPNEIIKKLEQVRDNASGNAETMNNCINAVTENFDKFISSANSEIADQQTTVRMMEAAIAAQKAPGKKAPVRSSKPASKRGGGKPNKAPLNPPGATMPKRAVPREQVSGAVLAAE